MVRFIGTVGTYFQKSFICHVLLQSSIKLELPETPPNSAPFAFDSLRKTRFDSLHENGTIDLCFPAIKCNNKKKASKLHQNALAARSHLSGQKQFFCTFLAQKHWQYHVTFTRARVTHGRCARLDKLKSTMCSFAQFPLGRPLALGEGKPPLLLGCWLIKMWLTMFQRISNSQLEQQWQ